ncbi:MAG TPA: 3-deoxy-manno-octulosonate cytidylyltransferase [Acidiferrobacteraceae bacterium]|nr:3-deoxy-manno-octulosonate cytidylyltransferase [Acidiferrobacteraceae bacterium]
MRVLIPARFASSRLPGKMLADVCGKPLLERVFECARGSGATEVVVATDDERIAEVASRFADRVCLTSVDHPSGTARLAEAIAQLGLADDEVIVNLQGDEPLIPGVLLNRVAALVEGPDCPMATVAAPIRDYDSLLNPNIVKVVRDRAGRALYFSRAPIPWPRDCQEHELGTTVPVQAWHHIGLYAYRAGFVRQYAAWPRSPLEDIEMLEQLRVLWHGVPIAVCEADERPAAGVDTPEDLARVRAHFRGRT